MTNVMSAHQKNTHFSSFYIAPFVYNNAPPISDNDVIDFNSFVYIMSSPNTLSILLVYVEKSKNMTKYIIQLKLLRDILNFKICKIHIVIRIHSNIMLFYLRIYNKNAHLSVSSIYLIITFSTLRTLLL